jgi:hypothetical protein
MVNNGGRRSLDAVEKSTNRNAINLAIDSDLRPLASGLSPPACQFFSILDSSP